MPRGDRSYCNQCDYTFTDRDGSTPDTHYCPNCGARDSRSAEASGTMGVSASSTEFAVTNWYRHFDRRLAAIVTVATFLPLFTGQLSFAFGFLVTMACALVAYFGGLAFAQFWWRDKTVYKRTI